MIMTATHPALKPVLLTDKSRLQEIYDLRVDIWESSEKSRIVNRTLFPNGWFDKLDENAFHWVMINEQNKIIASARLNIFNSFEEFPYYSGIKHLPLLHAKPFAFYSRLIVHPDYRGQGKSFELAASRMHFCEARKIKWAQVYITNERIGKLFEGLGFENIGQAEVNYHKFTTPHWINVFLKEYHYKK